jgi:hypothetical protein
MGRGLVRFGICAVVLTVSATAQTPITTTGSASVTSAPQAQTSARTPLPKLYWFFLSYQRFLDRKADEIEMNGGKGTELRENLQRRLGFSAYQFEMIREVAQKMESDLNKKDAQAQVIIDAFHAKYPPNKPLSGPLPPHPPELAILQHERDNIIEQNVANLKAELGSEAADKLDSFLVKDFAPAVKMRTSRPAAPVANQKKVQP